MAVREALPTLTEDEFRTECERVTIPAPAPTADLARQMMAEDEGDLLRMQAGVRPGPVPSIAEPADDGGSPGRPGSAPIPPVEAKAEGDLQIDELPDWEEAEVVDDIVKGYLARLGSRTHVPFTTMSPARAREVQLDHWAGFLLSMIDGATSIDDIIDASPRPEHDTLRVLCDLRQQGLIGVRAPRR